MRLTHVKPAGAGDHPCHGGFQDDPALLRQFCIRMGQLWRRCSCLVADEIVQFEADASNDHVMVY
jgi:hypothetical protein